MAHNLEIMSVLSRSQPFCHAEAQALESVLSGGSTRLASFKKGEIIYDGCEFSDCAGIIISGSAIVRRKNCPLIMSKLLCSEVFGLAVMFLTDGRFVNEIIADEATEVLFIEKRDIERLLFDDYSFSLGFISYLSERISFLNRKIESLTSPTSCSRLAGFFLSRFTLSGQSSVTVSMSRLANLLGVSRATLYRAMDALCERGAVEKQGSTVSLKSLQTLEQLADVEANRNL